MTDILIRSILMPSILMPSISMPSISMPNPKRIRFSYDTKPVNFGAIPSASRLSWDIQPGRVPHDGVVWYYRFNGDIGGPWDGATMRRWHESGSFTPSIELRMGSGSTEFAELDLHFEKMNDAFSVPSQLCRTLLSFGKTNITVLENRLPKSLPVGQVIERFLSGELSAADDTYVENYFVGNLGDVVQTLIAHFDVGEMNAER